MTEFNTKYTHLTAAGPDAASYIARPPAGMNVLFTLMARATPTPDREHIDVNATLMRCAKLPALDTAEEALRAAAAETLAKWGEDEAILFVYAGFVDDEFKTISRMLPVLAGESDMVAFGGEIAEAVDRYTDALFLSMRPAEGEA